MFHHLHELSTIEMPKQQGLRKILDRFNRTGLTESRHGGGPKKTFGDEICEDAAALLQSNKTLSQVRSVLTENHGKAPSKALVCRMAKKRGIKSYKITRQHELPSSNARRHQFALKMHSVLR